MLDIHFGELDLANALLKDRFARFRSRIPTDASRGERREHADPF